MFDEKVEEKKEEKANDTVSEKSSVSDNPRVSEAAQIKPTPVKQVSNAGDDKPKTS